MGTRRSVKTVPGFWKNDRSKCRHDDFGGRPPDETPHIATSWTCARIIDSSVCARESVNLHHEKRAQDGNTLNIEAKITLKCSY